MSFLIIMAGLLLALIGWSVHYDDRMTEHLFELEQLEKEGSPELYPDADDEEIQARYGRYSEVLVFVVGLFYTVRGAVIGIAGIWLTLAEVF
jgi:hypothetical protein